MINDQIKLWQWLKAHQPDLHEAVCDSLPQSVIHAYDACGSVRPKADDIHRLNAKLSSIETTEIPDENGCDALDKIDSPPSVPPYTDQLLADPLPCLAYYWLVFSDEVSTKLHAFLPKELCQKIPYFIERLEPNILPQAILDRLEHYLLSDTSLPTNVCVTQAKIEAMECLVDDSMDEQLQYQSYFLNPAIDIQLFSPSDHYIILNTLVKKPYFRLFLAGLDDQQKNTWLKPFSNRQRTIFLDNVPNHDDGFVDISQYSIHVIRCIRSLQKDGVIDSTIKAVQQ